MAGLTAEQIAQVRSYEIAGERTRQEPIANIIQAQLGLSREDLENQRVKLLQAQEKRTSELLGPEIAIRQSQLETAKLQRDKLAQELETNRAMAPIERQTALKKIQELDSLISLHGAQAANVGAAQAYAREEFNKTHTPIVLSSGEKLIVPNADVYATIAGGKGKVDYEAIRIQDMFQQRERQATQDVEKRDETATTAEATILGTTTKGTPNINNPAVETAMDTFNATSSKPYFYKRGVDKGVFSNSPKAEKIPLIDPTGKALMARDVYKLWQKYRATQEDITQEEFVDKFIRRKK